MEMAQIRLRVSAQVWAMGIDDAGMHRRCSMACWESISIVGQGSHYRGNWADVKVSVCLLVKDDTGRTMLGISTVSPIVTS